jgi:acyl dehydratase
MAGLYMDDFTVGQTFESKTLTVTPDAIKRFAAEFDPQPFHLDEKAAIGTFFSGLAASGWHTAAMTMRLLVDTLHIEGGLIGASMDELAWPRPVRPGDHLKITVEVLELRPSKSRPDRGMGKVRTITSNQAGEPVQIMVTNVVLPRKQP